jgi:flagellar biosynthesis/type III secretory pathway protein FliH
MHYEGPRRFGRFIKKDSKVMEKVALVDFSFSELSASRAIDYDNTKRNVIHAQAHEQAEMKATVRAPTSFNQDLIPEELKRPIILPVDFTKEWERDKTMRKDRVMAQDEDEYDLDYEMAQRAGLAGVDDLLPSSAAKAPPPASAAPVAPVAAKGPAAPPVGSPAKTVDNDSSRAPFGASGKTQYQSMDVVGHDIMSLAQQAQDPLAAAVAKPVRFKTEAAAGAAAPSTATATPGSTGAAGGFVPMQPQAPQTPSPQATTPSTAPAATPVSDPEADAAAIYKERLEQDRKRAEENARVAEEAKAEGYRDGFRMGEEKAELQARAHASQLFGKVHELIGEFANLKQDILTNVQENFYELCQAMAEALIKREFSINPEAFTTVLRRAISEAVEPGKVKIKVNPETFDRVATLGDKDILAAMVKDPAIAAGDFKLESNLTVVDVSVSRMISDLLAKADLDLFGSETETTGDAAKKTKTDKAG